VRERENRRTWRSDLGSRNTVMPGKITVYAAQVAHNIAGGRKNYANSSCLGPEMFYDSIGIPT
jgi:hypothetical protein